MRVITFDLEIARPVEHETDWGRARTGRLGIACVCLYDTTTQRYHVYDEASLEQCIRHLESGELLVSYNGREFDIPCLEGLYGQSISQGEHCDILQAIWGSLGAKQKGYRMAEVVGRTLGLSKTAPQESAPLLYKAGRYAEVFDYCLNDVHLTRSLYNHLVAHGGILDVNGDHLQVTAPYEDPA